MPVWKIIAAKWDGFEEAFAGFDVTTCAMLSDEDLEKLGAHMIAIKDMAGLCKPFAAGKLVKALHDAVGLPIHFHTHDTSAASLASGA